MKIINEQKNNFQKCNFNNIYFLLYIIMDFINIFIEYNFLQAKMKYMNHQIYDHNSLLYLLNYFTKVNQIFTY